MRAEDYDFAVGVAFAKGAAGFFGLRPIAVELVSGAATGALKKRMKCATRVTLL